MLEFKKTNVNEDASSGPSTSYVAPVSTASPPESVKLGDLGFAKEKGFPWHPALCSGSVVKGKRRIVIFLGTGQRVHVNESDWMEYSEEALSRIRRSSHKSSAFQKGLKELNDLRAKLVQGQLVSSSGVSVSDQLPTRRFQNLKKDHLQLEEEENDRQLMSKMSYCEESKLWSCKDCPWKGPCRHKAKGHTRDCCKRRKLKK